MPRHVTAITLGAAFLLSLACYHATITTGATPSTQVIDKSWASSWIYGLVPPSTVETAAKCPGGVATVETQLPFVNMVVGILTLGIYTPMQIKVTCAGKGTASTTPSATPDLSAAGPTQADIRAALAEAAQRSLATGRPVVVTLW